MIVVPQDIESINDQLISKFGTTLEGKPKWRVVWSSDQTEFRKMWVVAGIQLLHPRVIEVPKYSYAKDRWILEKWVPHLNHEIATHEGGSYEPVWTFENSFGTIRPVWKAVNILVSIAEGGASEKKTLKDYMSEDEEEQRKEIELFENMIEDEGRNFGNQTDAFVAPVFMDSRKQKMRE